MATGSPQAILRRSNCIIPARMLLRHPVRSRHDCSAQKAA